MEEHSERALMKNLQKEQEREKRRLRDRQRRQSMSVEEREKHLARRRRNYQLRRQRAEVTRLDPSIATKDEILLLPSIEYHEVASISSINNLCNDFVHIPTDQRPQSLCATMTKAVALEVPSHKLSQLPKRPLLNQIKHLARSLHDPVDTVEIQRIDAELILQINNATSSCIPPKKLRLNDVKRIARALNSDVAMTADADDQSKIEGLKNIPEELKAFSPNNDGAEDK